jgi:uncharacterized protein YceK
MDNIDKEMWGRLLGCLFLVLFMLGGCGACISILTPEEKPLEEMKYHELMRELEKMK